MHYPGSVSADSAVFENAAASLTGGLSGSADADGEIYERLEASDFTPPDGRDSLVVLAITVGDQTQGGEWLETRSSEGLNGSLGSGSDTLITGNKHVVRVRWGSGVLTINKTSSISSTDDTFIQIFGSGGVAEDSQLHLVTDSDSEELDATAGIIWK